MMQVATTTTKSLVLQYAAVDCLVGLAGASKRKDEGGRSPVATGLCIMHLQDDKDASYIIVSSIKPRLPQGA